MFWVDPGEEGWGTLAAMLMIGFALCLLFAYLFFRFIFSKRTWTQVGVESVLVVAGLFFFYKMSGTFLFDLPREYKGHVIVVYDVKGQSALPTRFFSNKVKMTVPASGIILTSSSPLNEKYYEGGTFISNGENINTYPHWHDLPLGRDTIICQGRTYLFDQWIIKDEPNWTMSDDTLYGLNEKLQLACEMISGGSAKHSQ